MYLEKYTDEDDLYISNLISELDDYYDPGLSSIRKVKNRVKQESRDAKLSNVLNSKLEKRWVVIDEPYGDRNYELFSKLADVRSYGDSDSIDDPRGIPEDPSLFYEIKTNQWDSDAHSHSYFYLSELLKHDFSKISPEFSNFIEFYRGKDDLDDYRIVFFFDN